MKKIKIYFFGMVLLNFLSCEVINPEEEIPAYIYIESFDLNVSPGEGTSAQKITDAWVFVEDNFLGVYKLPATIPILTNGATSSRLIINPGIKENGISATPNIYPFLERYMIDLELEPAKVDTIAPTTQYIDQANFALVEDFEGGHTLTFDADGDGMVTATSFTDGAFEGTSVKFEMTEDNPVAALATSQKLQLPTSLEDTYLEVHYKSDAEFQIGLVGYQQNSSTPITSYKITLTPQATWNKIYINFTDDLLASQLAEYQIVFRGALPEGATTATVSLDNIKVIHF